MSDAEQVAPSRRMHESLLPHDSFRRMGRAGAVRLPLTQSTAVNLIDSTPVQVADNLALLLDKPALAEGPVTVAFLNMRNYVAIRRDPAAVSAFAAMDQLYPDGVGLQIARRVAGLGRFSRVSGTDTVPLLLARLRPGTRVFLLGGSRAISAAAATRFPQLFPSLILAGVHHGFFAHAEEDRLAAAIGATDADVVLVGMGAPLQEIWLKRNRHLLRSRLAICVGGLFHYWADDLRRAPAGIRRIGLEWSWILAQQPRKWRVYSLDAAYFGASMMRIKRMPLP